MLIQFNSQEAKAEFYTCDCMASAAEMSIEYSPTLLSVLRQKPRIKGYRLLCRMNSFLVQFLIALHYPAFRHRLALTHAIPHEWKKPDGREQIGCGYLAVGEGRGRIAFIPDYPAGSETVVEIIASPYIIRKTKCSRLVKRSVHF